MSTLAEVALRALVSRPLQIGLLREGREVTTAGYLRATPQQWQRDGATAATEVTFGPFVEPLVADAAAIYDDGVPVRTMRFSAEVRLPPGGATFDYTAILDVVDG